MYKIEVVGGDIVHCSRCGNRDSLLFAYKNGCYYCRMCLDYQGTKASVSKQIVSKDVTPQINYKLSKGQNRISNNIKRTRKDVYVNAVCGSGKTEIVFNIICETVKKGQRVGFVTPRREIVKEIHERLCEVFPTLKVICVYGGHTSVLKGDIVVLTAHQCFRFPRKFGLLILDEYDAFPLKGNPNLLNIVNNVSFDRKVYLSATFTEEELLNKNFENLNRRYHKFDLPVPRVYVSSNIINFLHLIVFIIKEFNKPKFIFVPTIKCGLLLSKLLFLFKPLLFTSLTDDKNDKFKQIKKGQNKIVICTTILERGITVKNLQVIVFNADHKLFDFQTLIQIAGRVGRKKDSPVGKVIFLAKEYTSDINHCIQDIVHKNNEIKTYSMSNLS